ncbi:type II secretion system protein N, partial [Desulfoplanes sp.]
MFGLTKGLAGLGAMFTGSKAGLQVVGQILSVPVLTRLVNLAVITLVVCMLMFAWLDRYETVLDDETTLSGQDSFTGQPGSKVGTPSRSKGLGEYRAIAGRDLFGTVKHAVTEEPKQEEVEIEQMPLASLRLKLMGTVVASDPAMRTAVIAEANGRNERMYREGESVKGAT